MHKKSHWTLIYTEYRPEEEGLREALCATGNGYFVTRAAGAESSADDVHYPGTYLAGGYNRLISQVDGHAVENEDLVNMPNWLPLRFRIENDDWFSLDHAHILQYAQELDLKEGILYRRVRFEDAHGRISSLSERRFVHMRHHHLAGLEATFTAENWSGRLTVESALDGRVKNSGVARYRKLKGRHLEPLETEEIATDRVFLKVRTSQSRLEVAQTARTQIFSKEQPILLKPVRQEAPGYISQQWTLPIEACQSIRVEKVISCYSSRDYAISEAGLESKKAIERAPSFKALLRTHIDTWKHLWERFDLRIETSEKPLQKEPAMILRLHIFQLIQTASPNTIGLDVGIPARGLHGEAYRGHIFWDEVFMFPFLNTRMPNITRALLKYRHRRLDEARYYARQQGYAGALFPWQSGSDGREESQVIHLNPRSGEWVPDETHLQRHVNAAVAYNIWQYYQVTQDMEFLYNYGAEMILEIARFWASIATYNPDLQRYEIKGVVGPDEYHTGYPDRETAGLDNNAYTNVFAIWVLWRALELLEIMPDDHLQELRDRLNLSHTETSRWNEISRKMRVVISEDGIIRQFEGYEDLEEFDWRGYREKYGDIQRLDRVLGAEGDTTDRYQVSKQADVLMLFHLFSAEELEALFNRNGYAFPPDTIPKNIEYYLPRTSNGSTLSRVVSSWVLARSDRPRSWKLFTEALLSDINDIQHGTTAEGLHLGAMAGTVDMIQRGYTGIEVRQDVLWFNPQLPDPLLSLSFCLHYRNQSLQVEITQETLTVTARDSNVSPIQIGFQGEQVITLQAGEQKHFPLCRECSHAASRSGSGKTARA